MHKVLIIEDDQAIRESLSQLLEEKGYSVELAENGQKGLDILRTSSSDKLPCVILLDLMMPIKDGYEFRFEQKADKTLISIPTVVMTAAPYEKYTEDLLEIHHLIRKPFDSIQTILQMIARFCPQAG